MCYDIYKCLDCLQSISERVSDEQFNPNDNQNLKIPLALSYVSRPIYLGFFLLVYLMSFVFLLSAAFCLFSVNFFCAYSCVGRLGNFIPLSSYQAIVVNR